MQGEVAYDELGRVDVTCCYMVLDYDAHPHHLDEFNVSVVTPLHRELQAHITPG